MLSERDLRALIIEGERFEVEFKGEARKPLDDRELVEAVVCLANGAGGTLLVGVEDDGRVTGALPRHGSYTDPRRVQAYVANNTIPGLTVQCEVLAMDGYSVVCIQVPHARTPTSTQAGVFRRRAVGGDGKPACVPYHFHEMQGREASRGTLDYSALVLPDATWDDLDPLEFERLRQTIRRNAGRADASLLTLPDDEVVKALGLGEGDREVERLRVAALLLLGREDSIRRLLPTHEVAFQVLVGTRVPVNDFFRGPVIRVSDEVMTRFDARNEEREEFQIGGVRVGIPDYSRTAFREAVHNAMVHRDYTRLGAAHVQWHSDRIEVSNPGGFVEGVRLDNLLVTPPRPRNPVLADAFKRIGLVERTGRGIDTIFEGQLRYGRSAPDYSLSTSEGVHVLLPGGRANLPLARLIATHDTPERPVGVDQLLLLNAARRERRLDAAHAAELIQKPEPAARAALERLVELGLLEARGDRSRSYHLSAAAYREMGEPAGHTRVRNFEPIQQEQMVLQYVRAHGRITRREAAELCRTEPREATRLLRCLVERGDLRQHGTRRYTYYDLPD